MAIESFDTLKTAIETWLIDDEIQTDVETFIQLAEARHRRELWIRQMRVTNPLISLTAGAWSVPLPDDYLKGIYFRFQNPVAGDGRRWLPPLRNSNDEDQTENSWSGSYGWRGPTSFTVTEDLVFDVPAHVNLTGELRYYKALTPLSAQNQSNALLERAPDIYLYSALSATAPYLVNDERLATWETLYSNAKDAINDLDRHAKRIGTQFDRVHGATP